MKIVIAENLSDLRKETVFNLWNAEYPAALNFANLAAFDDFLNGVTERLHYLLLDEAENLKGWLMTFTRENERWFSVILDSSEQRKGFGKRLLEEVKLRESEICGWVIESDDYAKANGERYLSPIAFYEKNGFGILSGARLEKPDYYCVKIYWSKRFSESF